MNKVIKKSLAYFLSIVVTASSISSVQTCYAQEQDENFPKEEITQGSKYGFDQEYELKHNADGDTETQSGSANKNPQRKEINDYLNGLKYNRETVVSSKEPPVKYFRPKDGSGDAKEFTVITREKKNLSQGKNNIGHMNAMKQFTYPGALVQCNGKLADGNPVSIRTQDRAPLKLTIDLPFSENDGSRVIPNPEYSNVSSSIDNMVKTWGQKNPKQDVSAQTTNSYSMVHSENQLKAAIGGGFGDVEDLGFKIDFESIKKGKKQTMLIAFRQVYYTVSALTPIINSPADVFGAKTSLEQVKSAADNENPLGMVSSVSYGRMIYAKLETSSQDKEVSLAFEAAAKGGNVDSNVKWKEILKNTSFTSCVVGGSAGNGVVSNHKDMKEIQKIIQKEAKFKYTTPVVPLSYATAFLDNKPEIAHITNTAEYIQTTAKTHHEVDVHLRNDGGYSAEFVIRGNEIDGFNEDGSPHYTAKQKTYFNRVFDGWGIGWTRFKAPANTVDGLYFGFDVKGGRDWPYSDVMPFGQSVSCVTGGTTFHPKLRIKIDDKVIRDGRV